MKAHAAEAMPIAFLAMHEERTEANAEVILVWEEVSLCAKIFNPFIPQFNSLNITN
jgi:hypothetical protein